MSKRRLPTFGATAVAVVLPLCNPAVNQAPCDPETAMETITEAEMALPEERNDVPAILTVRGEILEVAPDSGRIGESAELCYQRAIATARSLGSVMGELIASRRLARLLQSQGDVDAPRRMLEPLLARIDDGRGMREIDAAIAAARGTPEGNG
jgi:hypothetical protein